jgi:hypothetical protein
MHFNKERIKGELELTYYGYEFRFLGIEGTTIAEVRRVLKKYGYYLEAFIPETSSYTLYKIH